MRRAACGIPLVVALLSCVGAQAPADPSRLHQLFAEHRLFELRDAVDGRVAPAFYKGVVAAAFGHFDEGRQLLAQAIRDAKDATSANDAREALIALDLIAGRSSDAVALMDDVLKTTPARADMRGAREFFSQLGTQWVEIRIPSEVACTAGRDGLVLPLTVNGKAVRWMVDTGFSNAALTESEARMLGLTINTGGGVTQDLQGGTAPARTAIADRVVVGGTMLRNVPMIVYPDSQPPWNELPAGRRGTLGLPVAVALEEIGWTNGGACHIGASGARTGAANLVFDGTSLIARTQFGDRPLDFVLDTGNQGSTQLWARFGQEFAALVRDTGHKTTTTVHQIGGIKEQEIVSLPELKLAVAGFEALIRPAEIFGASVGDRAHHGNLGMEVLAQAGSVTLDFQAMRLTMR